MTLQEIFDQLANGELIQVSLGGENPGELTGEHYKRLALSVNLGLMALYKRFPLKEGTLYIDVPEGQTKFLLDRAYAVSNTGSLETKYIDDATDPFQNDLLKIEKVVDETPDAVSMYPLEHDREFPLNIKLDTDSCFTPSYKTLVIPADSGATRLKVVYRASHRTLDEDDWLDPDLSEIELPYSHLEALLYFVASRVLNPTGFASGNGFHEGNNYMAKYEAECQLLEGKGLQVDQDQGPDRIRRNGWV